MGAIGTLEKHELGNSGVWVSEEILGCWVMGGSYWGGAEDKESMDAIRCALENGLTTFDTAYIYGEGRSERVLGEALKGIDRSKVEVITKLWTTEMEKEKVIPACEQSLRDLGMDYVDVYFIHYPSSTGVPIGETMEQMMKLRDQGKIRCIGVSNFSLEQMEEARQYGEIAVTQPCYSLVWRFLDEKEMDYCIRENIGIIPYSPLAQGILTGKFSPETVFPDGDGRQNAPLFQEPYFSGALDVAEQLKPFAEKYGKTQAQIAINWLIEKEGISAPIVGGRNRRQVTENIGATGWKLTAEDFETIDGFSRQYTDTLPRFTNFFNAAILED